MAYANLSTQSHSLNDDLTIFLSCRQICRLCQIGVGSPEKRSNAALFTVHCSLFTESVSHQFSSSGLICHQIETIENPVFIL